MSKCEVCHERTARKGSVIRGVYYKGICMQCYDSLMVTESPSSGQASYNRGRDVEEHEADMIQPWNGDGKPSSEFIHLYPERAQQMFSPEEIDRATRS